MLKQYIQARLKTSEFLNHVLILMLGTGLAQAIPILASPIISRIYSPAEYGVFGLYTSMVSIGATFITLRYEQVIVLAKTSKDALNLVILTFLISIVFLAALMIGTAVIGKSHVLSLLQAESMAPYFYLLFPGILLTTIVQILNYALSREKKYKDLAAMKLVQMGGLTITQLGLGIKGFNGMGLIMGNVIGNLLASIFLLQNFFKHILTIPDISIRRMNELARNYKKFPLYNTFGDTINVVAANLHIILFLKYFGQEVTGIIAFTSLLFLAPVSLIATSFSQVFYQKIATLESKASLLAAYYNGLKYLLPIAAAMILVALLIPHNLIPFIFGEKWTGTSTYLLPLSVWFGFQFVGSSLSMIYVRLHRLGFLLAINILNISSTFFIIYGGYAFALSAFQTVLAFCITKAIVYAGTAGLGIYIIKSTHEKL